MKAVPVILGVVWGLIAVHSQRAKAAPFVNLNFEQATVPPGTTTFLPASVAFPGWTPRIGNNVQLFVYYNLTGLGEPFVTLYDVPVPSRALPVYEGVFSAALGTSFEDGSVASLSQSGDVPGATQSIRFLTTRDRAPIVTLNGNDIPLTLLVPRPSNMPSLYAGDISLYAGQSVELRFSSGSPFESIAYGLDAIEFSPLPIPSQMQF